MSETIYRKPVGVIGAGSFGTSIANLLAYNVDVRLYSRNKDLVEQINTQHQNLGVDLSKRILAVNDLQKIAEQCDLIFPIVPSGSFRQMMKELGPFLKPYHILIHGTKGFDYSETLLQQQEQIQRKDVHSMSEVIRQESVVLRIGCLSGPNLASEIMEGQPTATVISSHFEEVIELGKKVLASEHFYVFGSHDLMGAELAGALKNIIAIGSGILRGRNLGKNIQAVLITRGWHEMINFGKSMGADSSAFFGVAGIGDLVATCTSKSSRNFTFGYRLGQGEEMAEIQKSMPELAEGVRTLKVIYKLARTYRLRIPITDLLYKVVFEEYDIDKALNFLMTYPYAVDVDFLETKPN